MAYTDTVLTFMTPEDGNIEIEFRLDIAAAEPDVGIMSDWVDDWDITAVDGNTDLPDERKSEIIGWLKDEYGSEDAFLNALLEDLD